MASPLSLHRLLRGAVLFFALLAAPRAEGGEGRPTQPWAKPSDLPVVLDEFVAAFKPETARHLKVLPRMGGRAQASLPRVQHLLDRVGARGFEREFVGAEVPAPGSAVPDLTGYYLVRIPEGADLQAAMNEFAGHPDVDHVEPIGIGEWNSIPNDSMFTGDTSTFGGRTWGLSEDYGIDADQAWDVEPGRSGVVVAVLDTGCRYWHEDLGGENPPSPLDTDTQGNIWVNFFEIPGNGVDEDGNGFIDDVIGWDFVYRDNDPNDNDHYHGTHIAGIIGALTNNARGISGVAGGFGDGTPYGNGDGCKVMVVKTGSSAGVSMSSAAKGMQYVAGMVDRGINVTAVNISHTTSNTGGIGAAVAALQARDVLVVYAAGNKNADVCCDPNRTYLATIPGVLTVGATDTTGVGADFSNYGSLVDLAAPGTEILSTHNEVSDPDPAAMYYRAGSGTSYSAPHAVGVAALLEAYNPTLTAEQKADLMVLNTTPFSPSNTKALGTGILNARLALLAAPIPTGVNGPPIAERSRLLVPEPNPFNPSTRLRFYLDRPGEVSLRIFDVQGRMVRTLVGGQRKAAGWSQETWDGATDVGSSAASGVYFAVFHAGEARQTHRLVLLR